MMGRQNDSVIMVDGDDDAGGEQKGTRGTRVVAGIDGCGPAEMLR